MTAKEYFKRPKRKRYFGTPMDTGRRFRSKYLCFKCRKVRRLFRGTAFGDEAFVCGHCAGPLYRIGPMFRPPPANTNRGKKAWVEIEAGYSKKSKFYSEKRYERYHENK